jgi:hypothetical protein
VNGAADMVVANTNAVIQQSNKRKHEAFQTPFDTVSGSTVVPGFHEAVNVPVYEASVVTISSKDSKFDNMNVQR